MKTLIILTLLVAIVSSEYGTNYNIGNHQRQETIDANGDVTGHYSYIDPNGQTITVHYTAGKNGYRVINKPAPSTVYYQPIAPNPNFITPYTEYKGLQLRHNKYQALFRPANSAIYPAASPKQYAAYAEALRKQQEEDLRAAQQKANVLPAQFPSNDNSIATPQPPRAPAPYFAITPTPLDSFFNSLQDISYDGQPSNAIATDGNLRTIAANPLPPQRVNNYANRDATPITEDQEGPLYNVQYQYY